MTDSLLSWIIIYGPSMLALALLLGALGFPMPGTLLVLAGGAFVRQGVLELPTALAWALLGATTGDALSYGLGKVARGPILRRFGDSPSWKKAEANLNQRGGIAIYLTRWLLTPLAVPTNLVAGSGGYPFTRFLAYDLAGELTWLILLGGTGYAFSTQWEALSQLISDFSGLLIGLMILGAGIFFAVRLWRKEDHSESE